MAKDIVASRNVGLRDETRVWDWKKTLQVVGHGAAATTYGYAIGWQSVSSVSLQLYANTNVVMRSFGKWRFLTYNCLVMQFVAYSLCFTAHFVPRLRNQRDYFLTTFAVPVGFMVCTFFWGVWFGAGREYIFPESLSRYYPDWLNHVTHTIILPINIIEMATIKHKFWPDLKAIIPLEIFMAGYVSYSLFIRYHTGRFVYPFLNDLTCSQVTYVTLGFFAITFVTYKLNKMFHDFMHGIKSTKTPKSAKKIK